jgi:hypothetical protein
MSWDIRQVHKILEGITSPIFRRFVSDRYADTRRPAESCCDPADHPKAISSYKVGRICRNFVSFNADQL